MTGGLLTTVFAVNDAVNTPYDENTNCVFGPRIDAVIEGMLPSGPHTRADAGQLFLEMRNRNDGLREINLNVLGASVPDNPRQPYDGGRPYEEGEFGTGIITIVK
jgi:hypothetical protein